MGYQTQTLERFRQQLDEVIEHLAHRLPAQAPIKNFVHHNTLHGFQHLPFNEALSEAERITGGRGFQTLEQFRSFYKAGRITDADLIQALEADPVLDLDEQVVEGRFGEICNRDIQLAALRVPIESITPAQLNWQLENENILSHFQSDLDPETRQQSLEGVYTESALVQDLWEACLQGLGINSDQLHPEELVDLSPDQADRMLRHLAEKGTDTKDVAIDRRMRQLGSQAISTHLGRLGRDITLRDLLMQLTGVDILDQLRPMLLRQLSSYLDQGMTAWHGVDRKQGFYRIWQQAAKQDMSWFFEGVPDWQTHLESLPDDPVEVILWELRRLGIPIDLWGSYLEQVAMELPGWGGMVLWRHQHPGFENLAPERVEMVDFLAVRLVLDRLYGQRLCGALWQIEVSVDTLRWYFRHHIEEYLVREGLYNQQLPEYLVSLAQHLIGHGSDRIPSDQQWRQVAHVIWTWRFRPIAAPDRVHNIFDSGWRLFRLAQHMGLSGKDIRDLSLGSLSQMLDVANELSTAQASFIWLKAYELHYRDQLFQALRENYKAGRIAPGQPSAQLIFCMDDREEGIRRHLEEIMPSVETLGAAGFYGVPMDWQGLEDSGYTPLCPIVVVPSHRVEEESCEPSELEGYRSRLGRRWQLSDLLHHETRRNLLSSALLIAVAAPGALLALGAKLLAPAWYGQRVERLRRGFDRRPSTRAMFTAEVDTPASPEAPRLGFTIDEQVERVELFLRLIGLVDRFAPIVVMMGHGSFSHNNPHLAAYDCGACSGRHGGPNARVFSAMVNRPEIRQGLVQRGIHIPDNCWFLGAERNTADENIEWYDLDLLPELFKPDFDQLCTALDEASQRHAQERCRRLASAPSRVTPRQALNHVIGRVRDISQARPELGHATNAAAFIGRREMSRGVFFDRRVFLISYDATTDPEGDVLERLLLANAPVGAGINLEYYFSTVDNDNYGCGSKVTHNITGLYGVMDGGSSDLRTGLPRQMIEIHEAMRLQVVVEATIETLTMIYTRQPPLQELIGNGWLLLSAIDPDSGEINVFNPAAGFEHWQERGEPLPQAENSRAWYAGHSEPLSPARITPDQAHSSKEASHG
ncbi:MAG: DUF2309 domain-containing protein [Gammaproteobacteria bacterium]|nr:DUF2309 domain-containing protein [Gammaproteobacteria bacterium]